MLFTPKQQKELIGLLYDFENSLFHELDKTEQGSETAQKIYNSIKRQLNSIQAIIKKA